MQDIACLTLILPSPPAEDVFEYASKAFIVREVAYRYAGVAVNGTCQASTLNTSGSLTLSPSPGYEFIPGDPEAIMEVVAEGPIAIYFNIDASFFFYTSGVPQTLMGVGGLF